MYKGQEYNVFISYRGNSESGLLGSKIYSDLLHYSNNDNIKAFKPFFAPACIPKGDNFKIAIDRVFDDIRCFVMIIDNNYFDNCQEVDDMVMFEIKTALSHENIVFLPIVFSGFSFEKNELLRQLFSSEEISRFKHINAINYYGIYDFKTELDLIPVLVSMLNSPAKNIKEQTNAFRFDLDQFKIQTNKSIKFGSYPQNVVSDMDLINKIASGVFSGETVINANTQLLTFENKQYATIAENPFNKSKFDNGKVVSAGARNYYLCESITWKVLFENEEHQFLISDKAIDAVQFNLSRSPHLADASHVFAANNWEYSYARRWLNNEFFYTAFTETERQQIELVFLDNSDQNSYYPSTSANTLDRVFLVSHKEIFAIGDIGALTTDYAKARGAYSSTSASHYGKGDWWTRSPGITKDSIENIDRRGTIDAVPFCNYVDDTAASLRPCIIIKK